MSHLWWCLLILPCPWQLRWFTWKFLHFPLLVLRSEVVWTLCSSKQWTLTAWSPLFWGNSFQVEGFEDVETWEYIYIFIIYNYIYIYILYTHPILVDPSIWTAVWAFMSQLVSGSTRRPLPPSNSEAWQHFVAQLQLWMIFLTKKRERERERGEREREREGETMIIFFFGNNMQFQAGDALVVQWGEKTSNMRPDGLISVSPSAG